MTPFNPDKNRGTWASPTDFIFACVANAFKYDALFFIPSMTLYWSIMAINVYPVLVVLCTFPVMMIQMFLGQFSSSGFISAFRITPVYKCLGYVSLAVNLLTLTFYSLNAAIPVFFLAHSFQSVLPWSCEGIKSWMKNTTKTIMPCNLKNGRINSYEEELAIPSQLFFSYKTRNTVDMRFENNEPLLYSWPLMVCNLCVWVGVWLVLTKKTPTIGKILRHSTTAVIAILCVYIVRLGFLPGAFQTPNIPILSFLMDIKAMLLLPLLSLGGLGPGWGSIMSMASYNNFKADILKHSKIVCLGQAGLLALVILVRHFVMNFWMSMTDWTASHLLGSSFWMFFLTVPSALATLEEPQFWSILFFVMITVGLMNIIVVQLFSVVTSLFDEFESLRKSRSKVILLLTAALCICSMIFCTNWGLFSFEILSRFNIISQLALNFMMLVVVLWIYGRERLQRDFRFMTSREFESWMKMSKFLSPLFLLICAGIAILLVISITAFHISIVNFLIMVAILPWTIVPIYCCMKSWRSNLKWHQDGTHPNDWHPVDVEDKRRYRESLEIRDPSHPLTSFIAQT